MIVINKFARSAGGGKVVRPSRPGPKGDGFLLDGNGNYLVSNKRIRQLADPEGDDDAVNARWSKARIERIHERWVEAMNMGEMCMGQIGEVQAESIALESRIEKLKKKWKEAVQVFVRAKGPDETTYTVATASTDINPDTAAADATAASH